MSNTPKWHREHEIFSRIKRLIMLEGNILDSYQFPYEGKYTAAQRLSPLFL